MNLYCKLVEVSIDLRGRWKILCFGKITPCKVIGEIKNMLFHLRTLEYCLLCSSYCSVCFMESGFIQLVHMTSYLLLRLNGFFFWCFYSKQPEKG